MSSPTSVREYAVLYLGGKKAIGGAVSGGNVLLNAGQHSHDGPEHTGLLPLERISTTELDTTLVAQPDGSGGIEFSPFTAGIDVDDSEVPVAVGATRLDFTSGLLAAMGSGSDEVDISLDDDYIETLIAASVPGIVPTYAWLPVMVDDPNIVTTDGGVIWTPLTLTDGAPVVAYAPVS